MIIEARILTSRMNPVLKVRYYPHDISHETIIDLLNASLSMESMACEPPVQSLVLLSWASSSGIDLKLAIAKIQRAFVVIVADELEHDASLLETTVSVARDLPEIIRKKSLTRLNLRSRKDLQFHVNERILDYVRFVLFGYPRSGKTSLFALVTGQRARVEYFPTLKPSVAPDSGLYQSLLSTDDFSVVDKWYLVANHIITVYDLPGTPDYWSRWTAYLKRADVGVLVLRSNRRDIIQAKALLRKFKHTLPQTVIAIANYQDLPESSSPELISRTLGITTYGMDATDLDRMEQLRDIFKTVAVTRLQLTTIRS